MTSGIVAFSGPRACGKSTIAEHLCIQHGYTRIAFADAIRYIARCVNPDLQNERAFLAELGQVLRNCLPKFAILVVQHSLKTIEGPVVIEDIRFPSEMEFCKSIGATTIRFEIDRESQIQRLLKREGDHENIQALLDCDDELRLGKKKNWDFTISATGDFRDIAAKIHELNGGVNNE